MYCMDEDARQARRSASGTAYLAYRGADAWPTSVLQNISPSLVSWVVLQCSIR